MNDSGVLELLTVGRIGVDLYAEQLNVPLNDVQSFRKSIGGTATNVAVATARLGHRTAVFTRNERPVADAFREAASQVTAINRSS